MEKPNSQEMFVKKNIELNGVELTLITHRHDKVHGAMFRGEFSLCKSYLAELEVLQDTVRPGYQIIDAGANIGSIAITLAKTEPGATIYCFEPDILNFSLLNLNIILNQVSNIKTFNYALGKKREFIEMYLSKTNFGDHRSAKCLKNDLNEACFTRSASKILKVNPIEFFKELLTTDDLRIIDLIKIDTQGADFEILGACIPLLKSDAVVAIEYSPYHLDANGTTKEEIAEVLQYFSQIYKINSLELTPRLTAMDLWSVFDFYNQHYQHYSSEYDLILKND